MPVLRQILAAAACIFAVAGASAGGASAAGQWNGQGQPNDPEYNSPKKGECLHSVQWYLFSFIPSCTTIAKDPERASGMSADKAWANYSPGRPDEVYAYVEGGINWAQESARQELANRVFINKGELPLPQHADGAPCAAYDCNADGILNIQDYAADPRIKTPYVNESLTPEDLIVTFGHCQITGGAVGPEGCPADRHFDNDGNGYENDVSGWNFLSDNNDPATGDTDYHHANNQMKRAVAEANNGVGGVGVCPGCMLLPIKAGHEAFDTTDRIARATMFAVDSGASVLTLLTAELGYSDFTKQALQYAWDQGVVVTGASNDFDSSDHQEGMFWPHMWPGNGLQSDDHSSSLVDLSKYVTTFRNRANETSFGPHALFSVPNAGGSTSESTPTQAGVALLVGSYGRRAAEEGKINGRLNAGEIMQVVRSTASNIDSERLGWPGLPGATFNIQYGYGRPNIAKADAAVAANRIPSVPDIKSPDWYALYDPVKTDAVPITADIKARRASSFDWKVQYGLGPQPTEAQFRTIASGHSGGPSLSGKLADLDLSKIPASFYERPFAFTKDLSSTEQYDVTIRIQSTDDRGLMGEDRRAIAVFHDSTIHSGYPRLVGQGKDSAPVLADLQGSGKLNIIYGDAQGRIHALDPTTGAELPGWPAHTSALDTTQIAGSAGVRSGTVSAQVYEPIETTPAVGDLFGTGALNVIVSSTSGGVYAFDRFGHLLPGFPRVVGADAAASPVPPVQAARTRPPMQGAFATPVLAPMPGASTKLSIVQAALDGQVYAFDGSGTTVPGWPVNAAIPANKHLSPKTYTQVNDFKLVATPTLADLNGDGKYELVLRSQQTEQLTGLIDTLGAGSKMFELALWADGNRHPGGAFVPGFPASIQAAFNYYGSAQDVLTEGPESASAGPLDGNGRDQIMQSTGFLGFNDKLSSSGQVKTSYPDITSFLSPGFSLIAPAFPDAHGRIPTKTRATSAVGFTASGTLAKVDGQFRYFSPGVDLASMTALQHNGIAQRITNFMRANNTKNGKSIGGFPAPAMGLSFLTAPAVADVTGDGKPEVISNSDSNNVGAWGMDGKPAAGWPKFTGGWTLWTPAVGDVDGDGKNEVVVVTREGYLFVWDTPGKASENQAYSWHQDNWHTGRYGMDTRPPSIPSHVSADAATDGAAAHRVCFTAPGDDWHEGTAKRYEVRTFAERPTPETFGSGTAVNGAPAPAAAGTKQCVDVTGDAAFVGIRAVDSAGLIGLPAALALG